MTTCPRCGLQLRAPVAACPRCNLRFAPPQQHQAAPGYDGSAPAWVRQAQQQPQGQPGQSPYPGQPAQGMPGMPGANGNGYNGQYGQPPAGQRPAQPQPNVGAPAVRPGFSISELVSEEALPEWLRQASNDAAQPTQRQPAAGVPPAYNPAPQQGYPAQYPAQNPAPYPPTNGNSGNNGSYGGYGQEPPMQRPNALAFPSLESAGSPQAPMVNGGMPASSLLDPNALPAWLGGPQGGGTVDRGGEGMRAQSLVDDSALPGWLRQEPASPPQLPAAPPPADPSGWGNYAAQNQPAAAFMPAAPAVPMGLPAASAPYQQPQAAPVSVQPGFSAQQLIDPNALPEWMKAAGGPAAQPQPGNIPAFAQGIAPTGAQAGPQAGWSASDLIDPSALPEWVRGNDPGAPPQANAAMMSITSERTARMPAPQGANPPAEAEYGASRVAATQNGAPSRKYPAQRPLDDHEMPDWLRNNGANGAGGQGQRGAGGASVAGYPSRAGRSWNGYEEPGYGGNGYDERARGQRGPASRNGQQRPQPPARQHGHSGQTGRRPASRMDQSWAEPDGYDQSPWGRSQPSRQHQRSAPKKRKGGFFGFLRRD